MLRLITCVNRTASYYWHVFAAWLCLDCLQCTAPVGSKFYLWAGDAEPFSTNEFGDIAQVNLDRVFRHLYFKQDVMASIVISPSSSSSDPVLRGNITERKCTPRRPPYAAGMHEHYLLGTMCVYMWLCTACNTLMHALQLAPMLLYTIPASK